MKTYRIGDTVRFRVRIDGNPATDNPTAVVHDEVDAPVTPSLTIGSGLSQIGSTRIVVGTFVPDANGEWSVHMVDDSGMDVVKQFIVGAYSLGRVGAIASTIEAKIDSQDVTLANHDIALAAILAGVTSGGGSGHFG